MQLYLRLKRCMPVQNGGPERGREEPMLDLRRRRFISLLGGAAVTWPLAARAQQAATPVIGLLSGVSAAPFAPLVEGFRSGLRETGYFESRNLTIEYRWADGKYDRLPALAANLVEKRVAVIFTMGEKCRKGGTSRQCWCDTHRLCPR